MPSSKATQGQAEGAWQAYTLAVRCGMAATETEIWRAQSPSRV